MACSARRRVFDTSAGQVCSLRVAPLTTSTRDGRTWASSGTRRATSRTSRLTASVMLGRRVTARASPTRRAPTSARPSGRLPPSGGLSLAGPIGTMRAAMITLLAFAALIPAALTIARLRRRVGLLSTQVEAMGERLRDLGERVDAAQADVAHAVTQSGIAESLLVEKGIADEEEVEALRRRFDEDDDGGPAAYEPERDGVLH